ncbi:UDP-2,3-diacylglucosamine diphosphatase [Elusimicrobiota bacterium]
MYSLFTADLHLKLTDSEKPYANFKSFLNSIKGKCDKLYILGDLFTYWYEHPEVNFYSKNPALKAIKEFKKSGAKVYFLIGNRDFAAGKYFQEYSDVDFIGEDMTIDLPGKKILLTHGDRLAKKDIRYQIWRKFVRSKISSFVFKRLPVGYAISIADRFKTVGKNNPIAEKTIVDMISDEAVEYFKKDYDIIIAGHAHFKCYKDYEINGKTRKLYILPEFNFPGQFLTLENGILEYKQIS